MLGCAVLSATNAAGGLGPGLKVGHSMMIADHINLLGINPLTGPNMDEIGVRFPPMADAYSPRLRALAPDVIVMSEITWYVLDDLDAFVTFIRKELPNCLLLHLLMTYNEGTQKYGREFFPNLDGILRFFAMHVLERGQVRLAEAGRAKNIHQSRL